MGFEEALLKRGWTAIDHWAFRKGSWEAVVDTSSWLEVRVNDDLRLSDIEIWYAHGDDALADWTVSLVEHLCGLQDDRLRLWRAVERARDASDVATTKMIALEALQAPRAPAFELGGRSVRTAVVEEQAGMRAEIARLVTALEAIRDAPDAEAARAVAERTLAACHHNWYYHSEIPEGSPDRFHCPICGKKTGAR